MLLALKFGVREFIINKIWDEEYVFFACTHNTQPFSVGIMDLVLPFFPSLMFRFNKRLISSIIRVHFHKSFIYSVFQITRRKLISHRFHELQIQQIDTKNRQ